VFSNLVSGHTRGVEMWTTWQATLAWRLSGGIVAEHISTTLDANSKDISGASGLATSDPNSYWKLRSSYAIAEGHSIEVLLRHYGKLDRPVVPACILGRVADSLKVFARQLVFISVIRSLSSCLGDHS
jgi:iron complex outermembrane receptor protein